MRTALIPDTAPFNAEEIESLNRLVSSATATQRAWLSGFLAGLDVAPAAHKPAPAAKPSEPLTILFASESGNSEKLAGDMAKAARRRGFKPTVIDFADLDMAALAGVRRLAVIAATWGEGDPPARAAAAYRDLMSDAAPRLNDVEFAVLALGDRAYAEFCAVGKAIDERLEALGARRIAERIDCDLDFATPAGRWIDGTLGAFAPASDAGPITGNQVIEVDFGNRAEPSREVVEAVVAEHINLNSSRSDKQTIHIELAFDGAVPPYHPGDSLEIYPHNDPALVEALLAATGLAGSEALRAELTSGRDITTLSIKTLETYAEITGHKDVKALIAGGTGRDWIVGRQLIDLFEAYPFELSAEALRSLTRPLAPRAYSIASSRREVGDEAHLLVAAVRYESHGRARAGVASTFVADRLKKGERVRVKLRPNKHFALPADDRDIIMVGPGTGVAPFRAFVQERRAAGATGRSWLFFGDRHFTHDFLYQLEWQDALKDGALTRMDVAFSRDAPQKVYVQNRMWEQRRELVEWLDKGAYLYVCGDAKAMAKDVRATLVRVFADVKELSAAAAEDAVREMERGKRYLQDVY
jgi:sulfite reductase (NADPH) flavoprotein alpha-component